MRKKIQGLQGLMADKKIRDSINFWHPKLIKCFEERKKRLDERIRKMKKLDEALRKWEERKRKRGNTPSQKGK